MLGFPVSSAGKESSCNAGDSGLITGLGSFPGEGRGLPTPVFLGFPGGSDGKESTCTVGAWRRPWQPTPVFLPGECPWTGEPGSYSPWGLKESDTTERLSRAHMYIFQRHTEI